MLRGRGTELFCSSSPMPARPRLRAGCTELQGLKRKQKNGSKRKQKSARRGRGESKRSLAPGCASPPCPGKLPSSCGSVGMAPGWVWGAPNHGGCSRGVWVLMLRSPLQEQRLQGPPGRVSEPVLWWMPPPRPLSLKI